MKIVLNSKFFSTLSAEQLGEKAITLGYDGIDICIRPGHRIHVENALAKLPEAARTWRSQGLICPLASAAVDVIDPNHPDTESLYAACEAANIPRLKMGFFRFSQGDEYWQVLDAARAQMEGFVSLSEKYAVQTCYQIHSGPCIGSNCAGLMHLIQGFDPQYLGAYPDLGHLVLDGEDYAMGLSMIRDYISVVGIKDAKYTLQPEGHTPPYIPEFIKIGEGCVDWQRCLRILKDLDFKGPLSVHTEYSFNESIIRDVGYAETSPPNLERFAKEDAAFLRNIISSL